jgi:carbon-monoxide dehydrogenase medium subunit
MFEFSYVKPRSLSEVSAFIAANPDAKLLAGGMTLIPTLKQRLARPTHLVDIGGLSELATRTVARDADPMAVAMAVDELLASPRPRAPLPPFTDLVAAHRRAYAFSS